PAHVEPKDLVWEKGSDHSRSMGGGHELTGRSTKLSGQVSAEEGIELSPEVIDGDNRTLGCSRGSHKRTAPKRGQERGSVPHCRKMLRRVKQRDRCRE